MKLLKYIEDEMLFDFLKLGVFTTPLDCEVDRGIQNSTFNQIYGSCDMYVPLKNMIEEGIDEIIKRY